MKLKFYFRQLDYANRVEAYLVGEDANGKRFLAKPIDLVFEPMGEGLSAQPTLQVDGFMSRELLPALANGLAESGYRPESNDAGELKATKAHLEDMRTLVLKNKG